MQWCEHYNINNKTFYTRLSRCWSIMEALTGKITHMNKSVTVLKALLLGLEIELNGITVKLFKAGDISPFNPDFELEVPFLAQKMYNETFDRVEWLGVHDFQLLDFIEFAESMPHEQFMLLAANVVLNTTKI